MLKFIFVISFFLINFFSYASGLSKSKLKFGAVNGMIEQLPHSAQPRIRVSYVTSKGRQEHSYSLSSFKRGSWQDRLIVYKGSLPVIVYFDQITEKFEGFQFLGRASTVQVSSGRKLMLKTALYADVFFMLDEKIYNAGDLISFSVGRTEDQEIIFNNLQKKDDAVLFHTRVRLERLKDKNGYFFSFIFPEEDDQLPLWVSIEDFDRKQYPWISHLRQGLRVPVTLKQNILGEIENIRLIAKVFTYNRKDGRGQILRKGLFHMPFNFALNDVIGNRKIFSLQCFEAKKNRENFFVSFKLVRKKTPYRGGQAYRAVEVKIEDF